MNFKIISADLLDEMEQRYRAQFINSIHGFKPANLLGTQNKKGQSNLSIFSSVFHLGANPALVGMIVRPHSTKSRRHSYENILATGFYTLNQVHKGIYQQAHQTSARYSELESEFEATGLQEEYLLDFPAPFVLESKLKMALELKEVVDIKINNTHMLIGEIKWIIIPDDSILEDGTLDLEAIDSVAISGLNRYHQTTLLEQLPYAKAAK